MEDQQQVFDTVEGNRRDNTMQIIESNMSYCTDDDFDNDVDELGAKNKASNDVPMLSGALIDEHPP